VAHSELVNKHQHPNCGESSGSWGAVGIYADTQRSGLSAVYSVTA